LQGERADGRQLFAGPEQARCHQVLDLIDDLAVDRHAVGHVDGEVHCEGLLSAEVQVYGYTDTILARCQALRFSGGAAFALRPFGHSAAVVLALRRTKPNTPVSGCSRALLLSSPRPALVIGA